MEQKVNYVLVGFFVIVLSIILVASILWLSVGTQEKYYQTYQAFIQESVSGLNRKAPVKYRGVEVGYVRDIALVPERPDEVRVLLEIETGVPLKEDTLAILSTQGLTGLAHIELTGGSRESPPIERTPGQRFPEIKTQPSLLMRLDTAISSVLTHLDKISEVAGDFFTQLNQDVTTNLLERVNNMVRAMTLLVSEQNSLTISRILKHIEVLSGHFADQSQNLNQGLSHFVDTSKQLHQLSTQAGSVLTQLESSLASFEQTAQAFTQTAHLVNQTAEFSLQQIDNTTQTIDATTQTMAQTAETVSLAVQESRQDMNYFTRQALPEVTQALQELHLLLTTLRSFTQELERKPNMLLFGKSELPPGPGE